MKRLTDLHTDTLEEPDLEKVMLATTLNNPLRQMALELILALSNRFSLQGQLVLGEVRSDYSGALEAVGMLANTPDVSPLTIDDQDFRIVLDRTDTGIELSYVPLNPVLEPIYPKIENLSFTILAHLETMEDDLNLPASGSSRRPELRQGV